MANLGFFRDPLIAQQLANRRGRLAEYFTSWSGAELSEAQVQLLLVETRHLIEEMTDLGQDVEPLHLTKLFCNLALHIRLARQALAHDTLKFFGEQIIKAYHIGGQDVNKLVFEVICGSLSPALMREQLVRLYGQCGIDPSSWLEQKFWDHFVRILPNILHNKPIEFELEMVESELARFHAKKRPKGGRAAEIFRGLLDGAGEMGLVPFSVILKHDPKQARKYDCPDPYVWTVCTVSTRTAGALEIIVPYHRDGLMRGRTVGPSP